MLIGPTILLPWGLTIYTILGCIVLGIIGEIWWKLMKHRPEDDKAWSEGNQFVVESDWED
ncbi:MAG: hypothetical protein IKV79_03750 [Oscillospiraceae bacterium]|nr:hypothetical protein [Oscillospiraceae bacterium]